MFDQTAEGIISSLSTFAQSDSHQQLVAVAILCHGDAQGNICGLGENSQLSVQKVVNTLCVPNLQSVYKVMIIYLFYWNNTRILYVQLHVLLCDYSCIPLLELYNIIIYLNTAIIKVLKILIAAKIFELRLVQLSNTWGQMQTLQDAG